MGDEAGGSGGDLLQPQRRDAVEDPCAGAERERRDVQAELVEQSGGEVLVDRRGAAGDSDVAVAGTALACSSAASMPSVTKWNVVPPSISSGSRWWWVSTNTGAW